MHPRHDLLPTSPEVAFRLALLLRRVTAIYDEALEAVDLNVTQFELLMHVLALGATSQTGLAATLGISPSTLSRRLRLVVRKGLVQTFQGPDSRRHEVSITPEGLRRLAPAEAMLRSVAQVLDIKLGPELLQALDSALIRALRTIDD